MTWNSSAIVFDLDDTLYKESHYFKHIFSYFCEINEWPKSSYVNIINNFSDIRMQHKDIFGYYLKQNRDYWKINNEYEDIKYFGYLRNLLFSLYINIVSLTLSIKQPPKVTLLKDFLLILLINSSILLPLAG